MSSQAHWFCHACGTFDGPISGSFCDVCSDGSEVEWMVPVATAANWLRHIDRLDEIPGAKAGMPEFNPLWDAGVLLEQKFSGRPLAFPRKEHS
jgi:hypothetical protein